MNKLPINIKDSDYDLDSLISCCPTMKMLLRATAHLLRAVGRRFLERGEIDSADMGKYVNLSPEEVKIPLKNHPITISHVVVSGNDYHEFPLIPAEYVETLVANIDVDIWRIVEIASTR